MVSANYEELTRAETIANICVNTDMCGVFEDMVYKNINS